MKAEYNNTLFTFKLDIYSKIVFTVIAACLVVISTNIIFKPADANAIQTVQDVNLKLINGNNLWGNSIPVNIEEVDGSSINKEIPVNLQEINNRSIWGDEIPVNIKSVNGSSISGSEVPVRVK
jgi:hypothetical protein